MKHHILYRLGYAIGDLVEFKDGLMFARNYDTDETAIYKSMQELEDLLLTKYPDMRLVQSRAPAQPLVLEPPAVKHRKYDHIVYAQVLDELDMLTKSGERVSVVLHYFRIGSKMNLAWHASYDGVEMGNAIWYADFVGGTKMAEPTDGQIRLLRNDAKCTIGELQ